MENYFDVSMCYTVAENIDIIRYNKQQIGHDNVVIMACHIQPYPAGQYKVEAEPFTCEIYQSCEWAWMAASDLLRF